MQTKNYPQTLGFISWVIFSCVSRSHFVSIVFTPDGCILTFCGHHDNCFLSECLNSPTHHFPFWTRVGNPPTQPPHGSVPESLPFIHTHRHAHRHAHTYGPKSPQRLHLDRNTLCSSSVFVTHFASLISPSLVYPPWFNTIFFQVQVGGLV